MPKIKNIIIFLAIGVAFVLIYIFFIKPKPPVPALVSSPGISVVPDTSAGSANGKITQDFLNLLLSVKSVKLDDSIFSDSAFTSLHDSSITLTPDATQGRINPFAPLGAELPVAGVATPVAGLSGSTPPPTSGAGTSTCVSPKVLNTVTNTCVNPSPTCVLPKILNTLTNTCVSPLKS